MAAAFLPGSTWPCSPGGAQRSSNRDLVEAIRAAMRGEPFLYPAAVTALIRDILENLGMRNRVELTRHAIRRGLVEP